MGAISIFQYILYGLELAACITGFIYWKKIKGSFWKWFPFYLAFIVVSEQTGNYLNYIDTEKAIDIKNKLLSYFVIPVELLFLYGLYYMLAATRSAKRLVIACALIYMAGFIADLVYFSKKEFIFSSFSYCVGNLSLLITIISFFVQFVKGDQLINFRSSIAFWVSVGALVFYLGTLPFFALYWFLANEYFNIYLLYAHVMLVLNWIMYILFCIAFIWGKVK